MRLGLQENKCPKLDAAGVPQGYIKDLLRHLRAVGPYLTRPQISRRTYHGPLTHKKEHAHVYSSTRIVNRSNQVVAQDLLTDAWSPDGSKLAFITDRDGNFELYVMNADGTNPTNLSNNLATEFYPAWSPLGTKILFSTTRDGNLEIYSMNPDGSSQTRLTSNTAGDYYPAQ